MNDKTKDGCSEINLERTSRWHKGIIVWHGLAMAVLHAIRCQDSAL